jgi:hypothetical protein
MPGRRPAIRPWEQDDRSASPSEAPGSQAALPLCRNPPRRNKFTGECTAFAMQAARLGSGVQDDSSPFDQAESSWYSPKASRYATASALLWSRKFSNRPVEDANQLETHDGIGNIASRLDGMNGPSANPRFHSQRCGAITAFGPQARRIRSRIHDSQAVRWEFIQIHTRRMIPILRTAHKQDPSSQSETDAMSAIGRVDAQVVHSFSRLQKLSG